MPVTVISVIWLRLLMQFARVGQIQTLLIMLHTLKNKAFFGTVIKTLSAVLITFLISACGNNSDTDFTYEIESEWKLLTDAQRRGNPAVVPGSLYSSFVSLYKTETALFAEKEDVLKGLLQKTWKYKTEFKVPSSFYSNSHIDLFIENISGNVKLYLNDSLIKQSAYGINFATIPVKEIMTRGTNEIMVVYEPLEIANVQTAHHPLEQAKQIGVKGKLSLSAYDIAQVTDVQITSNAIESDNAWVSANITVNSEEYINTYLVLKSVEGGAAIGSSPIQLIPGANSFSMDFEIQNPKLWKAGTPDKAHLYNYMCELITENEVIHRKPVSFGISTLKSVVSDEMEDPAFYIETENPDFFVRGSVIKPISESADLQLVNAAKEAGLNLLRVSGAYANESFYTACDQAGILVWQDIVLPTVQPIGESTDIAEIEKDVRAVVTKLRNHPSVAVWCGTPVSLEKKLSKALTGSITNELNRMLRRVVADVHPSREYYRFNPAIELSETPIARFFKNMDSETSACQGQIGQFVNANGLPSYSSGAITEKLFENGKTRRPQSTFFTTNKKLEEELLTLLVSDFKAPRYFSYQAYHSQLAQAELLQAGLEASRRSVPNCRGSVYTQFNSTQPGLSSAIIDYNGDRKAAFYAVKNASQPVALQIFDRKGSRYFYIDNATDYDFVGDLFVQVLALDGRVISSDTVPVDLPSLMGFDVFDLLIEKATAGQFPGNLAVVAELVENGNTIATSASYFGQTKSIILRNPGLEVNANIEGNSILFELSSEYLAKSTVLTMKNLNGYFANNFVDVFPGKPQTIAFIADSIPANFVPEYEVYSLINSFKR